MIESLRLLQFYPISDPEVLASQALAHFKHFDDLDLKCRFYSTMAYYYHEVKNEPVRVVEMCKKSISLASQTGNIRRHGQGLRVLAWIHIWQGEYSIARMYAYEAQKLARVSGDLYTEAQAVRAQAHCWQELGHYKQSLSLAVMAQSLLGLCGMSDSEANLGIMTTQAELHKCKSEYSEAWNLHTKILQISANQDAYWHGIALLNIAEIEVLIGVPKCDVQRNIDFARSIFTSVGHKTPTRHCDVILANLYLREQDLLAAKRLFENSLKLATANSEIKSLCLEKLGQC
ncbi:hypothetical protein B0H14DRAFT_1094003 [Mycena olivaceomarginata]|nr:hypothetical protein B0H14DRAFT_1094003 [Mycena olivaceomarginata]